jgi:hypothetical protein
MPRARPALSRCRFLAAAGAMTETATLQALLGPAGGNRFRKPHGYVFEVP